MSLLINTRAEKVRRLCQEGSEKDVQGQIKLFKQALAEAEQLGTNREQNVCICRLNLATAYVHSDHKSSIQKGIDILTGMIAEAEKHHPALLGDIYYHKAVGMMRVNGNLRLTHAETYAILDTLYHAKHYDSNSGSVTPLNGHIVTALLRFERRDGDRCELLKEKIHGFRRGRGSEDADTQLQMVYELINRLLTRDPSEAKKEGQLCLDLIPKEDETCDKISTTTWCDLGLIYTQIEEYGKALRYFNRSHHKIKAGLGCKDLPQQCLQIRHNKAAVYILQRDFTAAVNIYTGEDDERSLDDLSGEIQDKDLLSHAYLNLAFGCLRQRFPEKDPVGQEKALQLAYTNYNTALDIQLEAGDMAGARKSLEGLAATVLTMEKSDKTLEWLKLKLGLMDYQTDQLKTKVGEIKVKLEDMKSAHDHRMKQRNLPFRTDSGRKNSVKGKNRTERTISYSTAINNEHDSKVSVKKEEPSSAVKEEESKAASQNNAGPMSAGKNDAGPMTAGKNNVGPMTAGKNDAGPMSAGKNNAGPMSAGKNNAGPMSAGKNDAGPMSAGKNNAGPMSAGKNNAGPMSAGKNNAGPMSAGMEPESHSTGEKGEASKHIDKKSHKKVKGRKHAGEEVPT